MTMLRPTGFLMLFPILALASAFSSPQAADPNIALAKRSFAEMRMAAERDGGALWGKSLIAPILLIDPVSRKIYGNQPDGEGKLKLQDGVWIGDLPANLPIGNYAFKWAGVRWTIMSMQYISDSLTDRLQLFMHESFHWIQPELGLFVGGNASPHLDTYPGRVWLRLEAKALERALGEDNSEQQRKLLADAFLFRAHRQALIPGAKESERLIEIMEGLAQYTGLRLTGLDHAACLRRAKRVLDGWPESRPTFSRWFAYDLLPGYGLFLDKADPNWRKKVDKNSDVVGMLATELGWEPPKSLTQAALIAAPKYGFTEIVRDEQKREDARVKVMRAMEAKFIRGPVLHFPLTARKPFGFRTDELFELPPHGTVFRNVRLEDAWGEALIGDGGALLTPDRRHGRVAIGPNPTTKGDGWEIKLLPGWELVPGVRPGDYEIKKS